MYNKGNSCMQCVYELTNNLLITGFATTVGGCKTNKVDYYNLDVIIYVGYCVKCL